VAIATAAAVTAVLASLAGPSGASADDRTDLPPPAVRLDRTDYVPAPQVVRGHNDDLFLGVEFDYYCALRGHDYDKGLRRMGRLAHLIAQSGRRVIYTAAPNKSLVVTGSVNRSKLPQGKCDARGMRHQAKVMDHYDDPLFLPLRRLLVKDERQVYYKTDHHWTSVGGSIFAEQVAARLSPELASYQRFRAGKETMLGVLNAMLEIWVKETAEAAYPDNGVRVRTAPGSTHWNGMPSVVLDHSWNSKPTRKTWPGHTLLIGDSFMMHALENFRPMFRHGRFMWVGHVELDDIVSAIAAADTVVIEIYQTGVTPTPIGKMAFRHQVRTALDDAAH
jgi:hypothetical protein